MMMNRAEVWFADTSAVIWVIDIDPPVLVLSTYLWTAEARAVILAPKKPLGALLRFADALTRIDAIN